MKTSKEVFDLNLPVLNFHSSAGHFQSVYATERDSLPLGTTHLYFKAPRLNALVATMTAMPLCLVMLVEEDVQEKEMTKKRSLIPRALLPADKRLILKLFPKELEKRTKNIVDLLPHKVITFTYREVLFL